MFCLAGGFSRHSEPASGEESLASFVPKLQRSFVDVQSSLDDEKREFMYQKGVMGLQIEVF